MTKPDQTNDVGVLLPFIPGGHAHSALYVMALAFLEHQAYL